MSVRFGRTRVAQRRQRERPVLAESRRPTLPSLDPICPNRRPEPAAKSPVPDAPAGDQDAPDPSGVYGDAVGVGLGRPGVRALGHGGTDVLARNRGQDAVVVADSRRMASGRHVAIMRSDFYMTARSRPRSASSDNRRFAGLLRRPAQPDHRSPLPIQQRAPSRGTPTSSARFLRHRHSPEPQSTRRATTPPAARRGAIQLPLRAHTICRR